jgi:hypothetical protein
MPGVGDYFGTAPPGAVARDESAHRAERLANRSPPALPARPSPPASLFPRLPCERASARRHIELEADAVCASPADVPQQPFGWRERTHAQVAPTRPDERGDVSDDSVQPSLPMRPQCHAITLSGGSRCHSATGPDRASPGRSGVGVAQCHGVVPTPYRVPPVRCAMVGDGQTRAWTRRRQRGLRVVRPPGRRPRC